MADDSTRTSSPTSRPALTQSRRLRLFAVFILYVAQGVPIGLFWFAIPAWLAANGASAAQVGYVLGLAALPWSLKLVNGFFMDRYTFLPMGRRRIWLIGAQLVMIALFLLCAALNPGIEDVTLLGIVAFAVNSATTFQDVAIDGLAVDVMEEEERSRASGMMFGGQSIGMAASTALSGAAIAAYGPSAAYLLSALFIGIVTLFVIATRERPGERLLPWSEGHANARNLAIQADRWWPILKDTGSGMLRLVSLIFLPVILIKGIQYGLLTGATPLIATGAAGWAEDRVSAMVGIAQLISGIAGMTIGGLAGDRLGAKKATILFFGCFLVLNSGMLMTQQLWGDSRYMSAFIIAWICLDILVTVATIPVCMRLCNRTVAATQFTLYMATNNFGISLGAMLLGFSDSLGGIAPLFGLLAAANIVAIGIMLVVRLPSRQIEDEVAEQLPQGNGLVPAVG